MYKKKRLNIVIVGHVDHGKSSLIGRLLLDTGSLTKERLSEVKAVSKSLGKETQLAYVMDQLKEEREASITIDTAQLMFKTKKRDVVIIDAPGHLEFIQNMMTGASQADSGVLIVDVKEGIQDQTKRHATLLSLLGLKTLIVVINKMDLVADSEDAFLNLQWELEPILKSLSFDKPVFIPVSTLSGNNVVKKRPGYSWFKGNTFLEQLDLIEDSADLASLPLRFPVQDRYTRLGKTIYVGQLVSGYIEVNQDLVGTPSNSRVKVVKILKHPKTLKKAFSGDNVGLVLSNGVMFQRGEILSPSDHVSTASNDFKTRLFWLSKTPLKLNQEVDIRLGVQELKAKVSSVDSRFDSTTLETLDGNKQLNQHELGELSISTHSLIVTEDFRKNPAMGRFIVEKEHEIIGVGIVVDSHIPKTFQLPK